MSAANLKGRRRHLLREHSLGCSPRSHELFQSQAQPSWGVSKRNIGAAAVELTADDLLEIDSAASKSTVQGTRYLDKLE